jgi:hypothetical protein
VAATRQLSVHGRSMIGQGARGGKLTVLIRRLKSWRRRRALAQTHIQLTALRQGALSAQDDMSRDYLIVSANALLGDCRRVASSRSPKGVTSPMTGLRTLSVSVCRHFTEIRTLRRSTGSGGSCRADAVISAAYSPIVCTTVVGWLTPSPPECTRRCRGQCSNLDCTNDLLER